MKRALLYSLVFIAIKLVAANMSFMLWRLIGGQGQMMSTSFMLVTLTVTDVLIICMFLWMRWSELSRHWVRTRPWNVLFWCVLAALGAIIPSVWLQEQMPDLPNIVEEQMSIIMKERWGYVVVGLLAPLGEELVFRGAVLRALLRVRANSWIAIGISAVLFALIHMNPAQMPHAFLIGLLLGWMYYRTDSIVPGVVYHWVNNTVVYVVYNFFPDPSLTLNDLFGDNSHTVQMALLFSMCIFLPSLYQLNERLRK